ncbi:MAG: HAD-IIB family hydrolase [Xenococcaceae cyanobacterium MO_188.B19]|nr:HAD-IIB family hydrolase [Xenococcaceae cyanobacterium MO_188.B19]
MRNKLSTEVLQNVRLVATDMDGTLTKQSKFTSDLLLALESLLDTDIDLIIITGRSAGWVNGINNYLPIQGAIAENGGMFYSKNNHDWELLTQIKDITSHRQELQQVFQLLKSKFPQIQESQDNSFRLTDWTFDIGNLNLEQLQAMEQICLETGWSFTYSTVQCHIKPLEQDKAKGLKQIVSKYYPQLLPEQIVTVGDSPNDESLFNSNLFPVSIGVANIKHYWNCLKYQPTYITNQPEVRGFCELIDLMKKKPG